MFQGDKQPTIPFMSFFSCPDGSREIVPFALAICTLVLFLEVFNRLQPGYVMRFMQKVDKTGFKKKNIQQQGFANGHPLNY
jgi:hypothetical protein